MEPLFEEYDALCRKEATLWEAQAKYELSKCQRSELDVYLRKKQLEIQRLELLVELEQKELAELEKKSAWIPRHQHRVDEAKRRLEARQNELANLQNNLNNLFEEQQVARRNEKQLLFEHEKFVTVARKRQELHDQIADMESSPEDLSSLKREVVMTADKAKKNEIMLNMLPQCVKDKSHVISLTRKAIEHLRISYSQGTKCVLLRSECSQEANSPPRHARNSAFRYFEWQFQDNLNQANPSLKQIRASVARKRNHQVIYDCIPAATKAQFQDLHGRIEKIAHDLMTDDELMFDSESFSRSEARYLGQIQLLVAILKQLDMYMSAELSMLKDLYHECKKSTKEYNKTHRDAQFELTQFREANFYTACIRYKGAKNSSLVQIVV